jgi:hypothetical protein
LNRELVYYINLDRLLVKDVVGALGLAAGDQPAADDDPALRKRNLLANLRQDIPTRLLDGGRDELGADVAFRERFLHIKALSRSRIETTWWVIRK